MSTIFATLSCANNHDIVVWWKHGIEWIPPHDLWGGRWKPTVEPCEAAILSPEAFKLLFGCETVPTSEQCWQFERSALSGWVHTATHTPPKPEPRTWTMEEIKQAYRNGAYCACLVDLTDRLEALPRKEP